jgi:ribosomal protein S24E
MLHTRVHYMHSDIHIYTHKDNKSSKFLKNKIFLTQFLSMYRNRLCIAHIKQITGHKRVKVYADALQDTGTALVIPKLEVTCRWMGTEIRKLRNPQKHLMILGCV